MAISSVLETRTTKSPDFTVEARRASSLSGVGASGSTSLSSSSSCGTGGSDAGGGATAATLSAIEGAAGSAAALGPAVAWLALLESFPVLPRRPLCTPCPVLAAESASALRPDPGEGTTTSSRSQTSSKRLVGAEASSFSDTAASPASCRSALSCPSRGFLALARFLSK